MIPFFFFFSSRRRHTRSLRDWSSDVCSSDLVVAERGAGCWGRCNWVRHRQRPPLNVDPVVALVYCRGRRQVKDWVGHSRVCDTRRHLPARAPPARFRYGSRAVAVLGEKGGAAAHVIRPAGAFCQVRQHGVRRSKREGRGMVARCRVAAHADVPNDRTCRALAACRLARCCRSGVPVIQRHYVLLVLRAEGTHTNVEHTILPEHVVSQKRGPDVRAVWMALGTDDFCPCRLSRDIRKSGYCSSQLRTVLDGDQARGLLNRSRLADRRGWVCCCAWPGSSAAGA